MLKCLVFLSVLVAVFSYQYQAHDSRVHQMKIPNGGPINGFSVKNCSTSPGSITVRSASLLPDPLKGGASTTLSVDILVSEPITGPISYSLDLQIKIAGEFVSVCDLIQGFDCTGNDFCSVFKKFVPVCPDIVVKQGYDCSCPFKQNDYNVKNVTFQMPGFPGGITGTVKAHVELADAGKDLICVDVEACLEECN